MLANNKPVELDRVREMLQFIPAHDRDQWIRIGMSIKSEFGESGFSMFDEWSQSAENYKPKAVTSVWRSFNDGAIGIGSLIHLARENGYRRTDSTRQRPPPKITKSSNPVKTSTGTYALQLWLSARGDDSYVAAHKYAMDKGISWAAGVARGLASGSLIGKGADCVIVPIRNITANKVQGVQCINADGCKQTFGSVSGGGLILGNTLDKSLTWYVCEGWASAVSMVFHHQAGNGVCAASFGKGRQREVAELIEQVYQPDEIVILMEDDT